MRGRRLGHYILRDLRTLDGLGKHDGDPPFGDISQELRLTGRRATDYTLTGRRSDGAMFPLEGSLSAMQEDGHSVFTIIVRDISARQQMHAQLARSFSQLRELSSALQSIREEERKHIARELHDDLGQLLATLRVDLTLVRQHSDTTVALQALLHSMDGLLVTAITSLRRIASNLRPRALDEGGLYFALQKLRHDFLLRRAIHFDLLADEADLVLDDARSTAIYRIVQEALTNIARHAEASHITIALHRIDSSLAITIQDDGRGIAEHDLEKAAALGLLGMRERVWGLNGSIHIGADNELGGTRIDISLPMHAGAAEAATQ
jgi:signal transduction histidine kinase